MIFGRENKTWINCEHCGRPKNKDQDCVCKKENWVAEE